MKKIYSLCLCIMAICFVDAQENQSQPNFIQTTDQSQIQFVQKGSAVNHSGKISETDEAVSESSVAGNQPDIYSKGGQQHSGGSVSQSPFDAVKDLKENISKRDLYSKTYDNPDGSHTTLIGAGPIHYEKNGQFLDIDHSITANPDSGFPYSNSTNLFESYFGATAHKGVKSKTNQAEVVEFLNKKMYWEVNGYPKNTINSSNPVASVQGDKLYYNNLFGQISAEFTVLTGKRDLNYIIPNKQALGDIPAGTSYLVFTEDIMLPIGWTFAMSENGVLIKDNLGNNIYLYNSPKSTDANSQLISTDTNTVFEVQQIGQVLTVKTKVKTVWLLSSERQFPVMVDPSVTINPNNSNKWTGWASQSNGGNDEVRAGYYSTGYRINGFAKFNLGSISQDKAIISVTSGFYRFEAKGNTSNRRIAITDLHVDPVNSTYNEIWGSTQYYLSDNITLGNNDNQWRINSFTSLGIDYVQNALTQGWVAISIAPYSNTNWSADNYLKFRGYSSSNKPYLTIVYEDSVDPCEPRTLTSAKELFIKDVRFLGTLNPNDVENLNNGYSNGYQDHTNLWDASQMPRQAQGQVVNVHAQVGRDAPQNWRGHFKAWVDWDHNGVFSSSELIYDTENVVTNAVLFGFVIPQNQAVGDYRIRIRTYNSWIDVQKSPPETLESGGYNFNPCEDFGTATGTITINGIPYNATQRQYGEAEDYMFKVIADCPSKITAVNVNEGDGVRCGEGKVTLSAVGPAGAIYNWYGSEFGDDPIATDQSSNIFVTPVLGEGTYVYWVTAYDGICESVARTPVIARVDPVPTIEIDGLDTNICGDDTSLSVNAWGDYEEVAIIDEKFNYEVENEENNYGLGAFKNIDESVYNEPDVIEADWKNRTNPYTVTKPPFQVLRPAMSSGYNNGKFVTSITDISRRDSIRKILELTDKVNASDLTNLNLEFDLYFQAYIGGDETSEYLKLQISTDDGSNWETLKTYLNTVGNPGRFKREVFPLDETYQVDNIKIRFDVSSRGDSTGWVYNIAAIDNVRLYGNRVLEPKFVWSSEGDQISIFDAADCMTPYEGEDVSEVCVKPNDTQLEENLTWTLHSTAHLHNGCTVDGTIILTNKTKVWNSDNTDWAVNNDWYPKFEGGSSLVPSAENCVIVKKTVYLHMDSDADYTNGFAKNLIIRNTGHLEIKDGASLTVTDFVKNQATVNDFIVENNANLIQINDDAPNAGSITVNKSYNFSSGRLEYNFITSPVNNGNIKPSIYPVVPISVQKYNEHDYYFYETQGPYQPGLAYAVQESPGSGTKTETGVFKGEFYNGILNYAMVHTGPGYNLVGNPYPSNLDIKLLYEANKGIDSLNLDIDPNFYFWDNRTNLIHHQMGSGYTQNQYAIYNATTGPDGTGVSAPRVIESGAGYRNPTREVKVGTGFMLQALKPGVTLHFENSYRIKTGTVDYTGKPGTEDEIDNGFGRYWLTMNTPSGIEPMLAVVYFEGGNNDFAIEDTESSLSSNDIYTFAGNKRLVIQGRDSFVNTDQIPLGYKAFEDGTHIISVYQPEGVFDNGQTIYLVDKLLNKTVNLSQKPYKFMTRKGQTDDRFMIVYRPGNMIGTAADISNVVDFAKINNQIVITSSIDKIKEVELFDLNSRSVYKKSDINSNEHRINAVNFNHQIVVVTVKTETGEVVTRKFVNN